MPAISEQKRLEEARQFEPWQNFYRESLHLISDRLFVVRGYGLCHWTKVVLSWPNDQEFYRLRRNMSAWFKKGDTEAPRQEYFYGRRRRQYLGAQNCFIEFCSLAMKYDRLGKKESQAIGRELGLKEKVLALYLRFYRRHFLRK